MLVRYDLDAVQAWWPFAVTTGTLYYLSLAGFLHPQSPGVAFHDRSGGPASPGIEDRELTAALVLLMETQRPYLRSDLCLDDVAALLEAPKSAISQAINDGLGMNFRTFVNTYRVEAVRGAIDQNANLTLVGVALDQGFNSKATFNRVFKQMTGVTPREYASLSGDARAEIPPLSPALEPVEGRA